MRLSDAFSSRWMVTGAAGELVGGLAVGGGGGQFELVFPALTRGALQDEQAFACKEWVFQRSGFGVEDAAVARADDALGPAVGDAPILHGICPHGFAVKHAVVALVPAVDPAGRGATAVTAARVLDRDMPRNGSVESSFRKSRRGVFRIVMGNDEMSVASVNGWKRGVNF